MYGFIWQKNSAGAIANGGSVNMVSTAEAVQKPTVLLSLCRLTVLLELFLGSFGKEYLLVFLFVHKTFLMQNLHHISHTSCPPPSQPVKSVFIALMCTQPPTRKPYWNGVGLLSDSSALLSKPRCH